MPLPFHCPHCGVFTEVDDVYAGHSGPCAACGKPITIPYIPGTMASGAAVSRTTVATPAARTKRGVWILVVVLAGGALATVLLVALVAMLLRPAIQSARSVAWESECSNNLERIGVALRAYHAAHGTYPPAYLAGEDGKPRHSWRVMILPYLGDEAASVYQQYDFSEPWDSPQNIRLADFMPSVYACPEHPEGRANQETTYLAIVGPGTLFPPGRSVSDGQIGDLPEETIAVVETAQSGISWLKPHDLEASKMAFEINSREETDPGSHHRRGGAHVLTADGQVHWLPDDFSPDYLNSMSTINGGEPLPMNLLDRR